MFAVRSLRDLAVRCTKFGIRFPTRFAKNLTQSTSNPLAFRNEALGYEKCNASSC